MSKPAGSSEAVRVVVRCRPMNKKEMDRNCESVLTFDTSNGMCSLRNPKADAKEPPKTFSFDAAYDPDSTQGMVFKETAMPIVESTMEGYNGTIFAYGQTGTGKTHTMEGKDENPDSRGIIPNSFQYIFDSIQTMSDQKEFLVRASFLEIYNEEIRDLLGKDSKAKLELKESPDIGVYVKDLTSFVVKGVAEIDHVMQVGKKNRTVGATLMNQDSSRSHSIFTITIETSEVGPDGQAHIRAGKLNLVDLAGSERQSKTGATGDRLKEATKINLSLSALGNVISALVDGKSSHIPYRDSKLTRLLQDSLGGNTKTAMIATLSPADYNYDETLSTLRYANRAKNIKNKPRINEDPKDAMLREFQDEIKRLKAMLEEQQRLQAGGAPGVGLGVMVPGHPGQTASLISPEEFAELQRKLAEAQNSRDVQVIQAGVSEEVLKQMEQEMQMKGAENQKLLARSAKLEARAEKLKAETLKFRAEAEKLASEREALLHERNRTEEEKARIAEELDSRQREMESRQRELENMQAEVENERKEKEAIAVRLKAMEEKLLRGSEMIDKAKKQEVELRRAQFELEERKRQEMLLSRELAERQEAQLMAEEKYASMEEEVASQKQKMKKLWAKLQQSKTEVRDLSEEFQQEREDLLSTIRELTQEIKLKNLVIDNFIPPEEAQKIQKRAQWDDERQEWALARIAHAGNNVRAKRPPSAVGLRRPVAESARVAAAMGDQNPRYRVRAPRPGAGQADGAQYENIINLELDMPERTTQDYEGPQGAQRMQAAINQAMADEQDGEGAAPGAAGEAYGNVYYSYAPKEGGEGATAKPPRSGSMNKGARPSTATRKARPKGADEGPIAEEPDPSQMYPQARGLVRK